LIAVIRHLLDWQNVVRDVHLQAALNGIDM
jgi:hypothetical protein